MHTAIACVYYFSESSLYWSTSQICAADKRRNEGCSPYTSISIWFQGS